MCSILIGCYRASSYRHSLGKGEITGYRTTSVHGGHGQPWALVARLARWNRKAKTVTVKIKQLSIFLRVGTMSLSKKVSIK